MKTVLVERLTESLIWKPVRAASNRDGQSWYRAIITKGTKDNIGEYFDISRRTPTHWTANYYKHDESVKNQFPNGVRPFKTITIGYDFTSLEDAKSACEKYRTRK